MRASAHIAIAEVVVAHGGDSDDFRDLLDVWQRVARVNGERADRIRAQAAKVKARFDAAEAEAWR